MTKDLTGFEKTKCVKKEKRAAIGCSYRLKRSPTVLPRAAGVLVPQWQKKRNQKVWVGEI